jgi:hypothetical protein
MTTTPANLDKRALDLAHVVDELALDLESAELLAEDEGTVGIYNATASALLWIAERIETATGCGPGTRYDLSLDDLPGALVDERLDALDEHIEWTCDRVEQGIARPADGGLDAITASLALIDGSTDDPVALDEVLIHLQVARDRREAA